MALDPEKACSGKETRKCPERERNKAYKYPSLGDLKRSWFSSLKSKKESLGPCAPRKDITVES